MKPLKRREFLADVGKGMLVASVGSSLASDLGLATALADEGPAELSFGSLEPLVSLMQETPIEKLQPLLVEKLKGGTTLRTLVSAGALANARTFGGQDYIGFHTLMALAPAYEMSHELPEALRPLPVLKVLYRNTTRIQEEGGRQKEVLHPVRPAALSKGRSGGEQLRAATRGANADQAESTFAALAQGGLEQSFNDLQWIVQDNLNVHRVVLAWRAWALLDLTGKEQAHTLLRQSVRYCVQEEQQLKDRGYEPPIRVVLPKLLDEYRLLSRSAGTQTADAAWVESLSRIIFSAPQDQAADAVAAALAEGMAPEAIGEAISLAANQLVLCDPGRLKAYGAKAVGSVHGDSVGVHASDAANAWRNIAAVSHPRNTMASLIVAAYHTAGQSAQLNRQPYPLAEHLETIQTTDPQKLLEEAESAIRAQDQARASAVVHRYGEAGGPARAVFDLLLRFATSEDGALHAEKYYRTVSEEFARTRSEFRWRHLVALARVTASEQGSPAPGYAEARDLLKV
jgi:hypothetical protein